MALYIPRPHLIQPKKLNNFSPSDNFHGEITLLPTLLHPLFLLLCLPLPYRCSLICFPRPTTSHPRTTPNTTHTNTPTPTHPYLSVRHPSLDNTPCFHWSHTRTWSYIWRGLSRAIFRLASVQMAFCRPWTGGQYIQADVRLPKPNYRAEHVLLVRYQLHKYSKYLSIELGNQVEHYRQWWQCVCDENRCQVEWTQSIATVTPGIPWNLWPFIS